MKGEGIGHTHGKGRRITAMWLFIGGDEGRGGWQRLAGVLTKGIRLPEGLAELARKRDMTKYNAVLCTRGRGDVVDSCPKSYCGVVARRLPRGLGNGAHSQVLPPGFGCCGPRPW